MTKIRTSLDQAFDEDVQIKTQFSRRDGKLRMVKRKIIPREPEIAKKQLFPISKERK
jgi:hypothetical protein